MKKFKLIGAIILVVFISVFISKDRLLKKDKDPIVAAQHDSEQDVEANSQNKNHSNSISNILLVNKTNGISKNYTPENITKVNIPFVEEATEEEKQMAGEPAKAVEDLVKQANSEGIQFLGSSAYRSYDTQLDTYTRKIGRAHV